ncbi:hypothetical protein [Burkholderia multivorans]|uniref:hypothetical protein n=1 Tax=Burkholderia multivorans TaxID=87883 RepID=UPI0009E0C8C1|nr:hypothetical protein [Burkholderia multivorans]SAJ89316.1 hypothetical protein UA11_04079 [Burkholderia multivorans]
MPIVVQPVTGSVSALSIIQDVAQRLNIPSPSVIATSTDPAILQLLALSNKEGEWLANKNWQVLTHEASFITSAQENQGSLSLIAPYMKNIINDTMWNRDLRRPVFGPMTAQRWEQLKAMVMQGPWNQFQIRGGDILFIPVPTAGQQIWFQYTSRNWCQSPSGMGQIKFLTDADTLVLRDDLFKLGLEWRWRKAKGLEYAQDFADYEDFLQDCLATDGTKDVINMGDVKYDIYPGILVPSGSWGA